MYNLMCPTSHKSRTITWLRWSNLWLSGAAFLQMIPFINLLTFVFCCVLCLDCSHGIVTFLSSATLILGTYFLTPTKMYSWPVYSSVPLPALPFRSRVIFCHDVFKEKNLHALSGFALPV